MKNKLKYFLLLSILISCVSLYAQRTFELVESAPAETILEKSGLSRPYEVWMDMIKSAKKTIDIETFYIANEEGEPLENIIKEIKYAAKRGVKIRIIIDESFWRRYPDSDKEFTNLSNISLKKIPFKSIAGGVMHSKHFIIDDESVFVGSQNFDWRALKHIHEMGARVKSPEIASVFKDMFEIDWKLCDSNSYEKRKDYLKIQRENIINSTHPVTIFDSKYGEIIIYPAFSPNKLVPENYAKELNELLRIIKNTKDHLFIQMYSYSLKGKSKNKLFTKIDDALRSAAKRGVEIKIILSDWAIKKDAIEQIKNLSEVKGIEIKFSTIPQLSEGYIPYARVQHCKYFVSDDDISWISSANWERDYFYKSRNTTLIVNNRNINTELENEFFRIWNSNYVESVDINKEYKSVKRN